MVMSKELLLRDHRPKSIDQTIHLGLPQEALSIRYRARVKNYHFDLSHLEKLECPQHQS